MPIIRHHAALRALVAVRGHPFDRSGFDAMFQAMDGVSATMVDQPAAALLMNPEGMRDFDVLVLYDMPGLDFEAAEPPVFVDPPAPLQAGFRALLEQGKGVVALHHALAAWPTWAEYHEWLGGSSSIARPRCAAPPRPTAAIATTWPTLRAPCPIRSRRACPTLCLAGRTLSGAGLCR
jgi:hypothetical protein